MINKVEKRIEVENLTKCYKVYNSPSQRMIDLLLSRFEGKEFRALNSVSFDVYSGEAFAVIGRNGSGKSTLLQILAGILNPTSGEVKIYGRVAALLELGSGFNPDVSGYNNVYMNAAIFGLSKKEIDQKIDEIIKFADIGEYIFEPVKTYSSGMFVRLAFSVAINVDADILLIDEALAVGDIFFRQKCYAKLNELKKRGVTIILVTHNMSEVEQFCDKAVYLKKGNVVCIGDSRDVVKEYYLQDGNDNNVSVCDNKITPELHDEVEGVFTFPSGWTYHEEPIAFDVNSKGVHTNNKASISRFGLYDKNGYLKNSFEQGEEAFVFVEAELYDITGVPAFGMAMYDQTNTIVHGKTSFQIHEDKSPHDMKTGKIAYLRKIVLDIAEGEYSFELGISSMPENIYNDRSIISQEAMDKEIERHFVVHDAGTFMINTRKVGDPTRLKFYGNADLIESEEVSVCG